MMFPPLPGEKGEELMQNYSQTAWDEWIKLQTMLINENHLNVRDKDARKFINEHRDKYLSGEEIDQAEGFIPPDHTN